MGQEVADLNAGKSHLFSFDQSSNSGTINVKMNGPGFEEKKILR